MTKKDLIKLIKSIGFELVDDYAYLHYEYLFYDIYIFDTHYDFTDDYNNISIFKFDDTVFLKNKFGKEIRTFKLKEILK